MKKMFIALAAIATFASCADDDLVENEGQGKTQQMTFVASVDDASTRTTINSSNNVLWSTGDKLSILSVGNTTNSQFSITEETAGTTKGTFTGSCPTSNTGYYAIYPYNANNYFERDLQDDGETLVDNPNAVKVRWNGWEQVAQNCFKSDDANAYQTCYPVGTPMIAYTAAPSDQSSKTVSMQFKHICAYFKVLVTTKVKSISIEANTESDALSAQDILVKWNNGDPTVTGTVDRSNQVTLTGQNGAALDPGYYYIPVLPGTITSGITLTLVSYVVSGNAGTYTKSSTGSVTLKRNNIYDLGSINISSWHTLAGSGTETSPYEIEDYYDLQTMYNLVNYDAAGIYRTAYYKQTKDITCEEGQYIYGIGSNKYQFRGTYDGGGFTIIPHYAEGGLFGRVSGGTIKNLTIEDPTWDTSTNRTFSGLVECVYQNPGDENASVTIENCTVTGTDTKSVTMNHYGGLVGQSCGNIDITNCVNSLSMNITTVNSEAWIGGIIGKINYWKPDDDTYATTSTGTKKVTAGINKCRNSASLTATSTSTSYTAYFGGIVGEFHGWGQASISLETYIWNCVNDGSLTTNSSSGKSNIGGIAGYCHGQLAHDKFDFKNCINNGTITNSYGGTSAYSAGGILGSYDEMVINISFLLCANTGVLRAKFYAAIVGENIVGNNDYTVLDMMYCYNSYLYQSADLPGTEYLAYPEGARSYKSTCNVNISNANIVSTVNPIIENETSYKNNLLEWTGKKDASDNVIGLDLDGLRTK